MLHVIKTKKKYTNVRIVDAVVKLDCPGKSKLSNIIMYFAQINISIITSRPPGTTFKELIREIVEVATARVTDWFIATYKTTRNGVAS
jgi:hypothetical protein